MGPAEEKLRPVQLASVVMAAAAHGGLSLLFLTFSEPLLAALNGVAFTVNVVSALLIWRTRFLVTGLVLTSIEVVVHLPAATVLMGVEAGYLLIALALPVLVFLLCPPRLGALRVSLGLATGVVALPTLLVMRAREPLLAVDPRLTEILFWWNTATSFGVLVLMSAYFASQNNRAQVALDAERQRSERLLLNMLPAPIAARLKDNETAIAEGFDEVTVLFADLVGFTQLGKTLPPQKLVALLNDVFTAFDELAQRHGLEKIKTIGDAYMVVGGLPLPRRDHAAAVAAFALDALAALERFRGPGALQLRIGIHSGPAVAGVIGTRKYSYDLWGDTVNTASRMESHGAPGRIQITEATLRALDGGFVAEERGFIDVKGLGQMRTYWLSSRAAEHAERAAG